MKRHILTLSILCLAALTAAAQPRFHDFQERGLILRIGGVAHTGDPGGGAPGTALSLSADYLSGRFVLGTGIDTNDTSGPLTTACVRGGLFAEGRSMSLTVYLTGRYRWSQERRGVLLGSGATIDFTLAGPLAAFVTLEYVCPVVVERGCGYMHSYLAYAGQGLLGWGIRLRI